MDIILLSTHMWINRRCLRDGAARAQRDEAKLAAIDAAYRHAAGSEVDIDQMLAEIELGYLRALPES